MKNEALKSYYILNGEVYDSVDSTGFEAMSPPFIYEVIRVIEGVALFLEDHVIRLRNSARIMGIEINYTDKEIAKDILRLIDLNSLSDHNIRIICGNLEEGKQNILFHASKSTYPSNESYREGVRTIIQRSERENPHVKVMNNLLRESINKRLELESAFEALLVDGDENITEGSRSNFFYVYRGKLYTPPSDKVLLGITRSEVINAAKKKNIVLEERKLNITDLDNIDAAFITGTSIDALPISSIDDIELDSADNPTVQAILEAYRIRVREYIEKRK